MQIAADFNQRVIVHTDALDWVQSPMPGVDRRALDRVGGEVARATSIVRYAAGSKFSAHIHKGGEELIVLQGVFQDEHGDFPVGSYIRNPPQSSHTPGSDLGCVIFVKLWQFQPGDRTQLRLQIDSMRKINSSHFKNVAITTLFTDKFEEVSLFYFGPNAKVAFKAYKGAEFFVLDGSIVEGNDKLLKYSWLRCPIGSFISAQAGAEGAKVWVKTGHLIDVANQIERVANASLF